MKLIPFLKDFVVNSFDLLGFFGFLSGVWAGKSFQTARREQPGGGGKYEVLRPIRTEPRREDYNC